LEDTDCHLPALLGLGPRQRQLVVWELVEQIMSDGPVTHLQGTGLEERDYLAISDIAEALDSLAKRPSSNYLQTFIFWFRYFAARC
jgi:hypothetical protein